MPEQGTPVVQAHTEYVDDVGKQITHLAVKDNILMGRGDPYSHDQVTDLLSRTYRSQSFGWPDTATTGTNLKTILFPEVFLDFPFVYDRLKNYRYWRGRAKITMRMNTTKFQYGTLAVSYLPFYDPSSGAAVKTITFQQRLQNNAMLFSANTGATVEFELPFVCPLSWWDVGLVGTAGYKGLLGAVFVDVLNPLSSASPTPPGTVEVSVFLQMLDGEVAGLFPALAPPTAEERISSKTKIETVRGQSGTPLNVLESVTKEMKGVITTVSSASKTIEPILKDVGSVASAALKFGALLDKPGTVAVTTTIMPDPDNDFLYGHGMDMSRKLTLAPEAQTAVSPQIMGSDPNPDLYQFMRRPGFFKRFAFDATAVTDDVLFTMVVHPMMSTTQSVGANTYLHLTPMAYYTSLFKLYRGGIKVLIHFNTSSFTTTRVRISHLVNDTFDNAVLADQSGDLVSRVIDITGDTWVEFTVPYLDPKVFLDVSPDYAAIPPDHLGIVVVSLVNPVATPDTTGATSVYGTVFVAAAEDYEVAGMWGLQADQINVNDDPLEQKWTVVYNESQLDEAARLKAHAAKQLKKKAIEEVKGQVSLMSTFGKPFPGLNPITPSVQSGMVTADKHEKITDLGKRYIRVNEVVNSISPWRVFPYSFETAKLPFHLWLTAPFMFARGSTRLKIINFTGGSVLEIRYFGRHSGTGNVEQSVGSLLIGNSIGKPIGGVEIPWFFEHPFVTLNPTTATTNMTLPSEIYVDDMFSDTPRAVTTFFAYGDDYSLGYATTVPLLVKYPPPPAKARQIRQ